MALETWKELSCLNNLELAGVTFIRDYIQLLFDGPIFNIYSLPALQVDKKLFLPKNLGYCDTLCTLINTRIVTASEDEREIILKFDNGAVLSVPLAVNERGGAEAAMLYIDENRGSIVW